MSTDEQRLVHVADDDDAIRRSVAFALKTSGFRVKAYESGSELLKQGSDIEPGCILLDIRMPGMDGLEVQEALKAKGVTLPVIIMTGHGDVSLAVRAMKAGAVDFIEKPFQKAVLLGAIEQAMGRLNHAAANREQASEAAVKLKALTPRERDVLDGLAKGLPNKSIAYDLGISPRTVEIHRANLMSKLGVHSLSEALRIAFAAEEQ
jgi:two-component system response regulator FixJ